MHWLYLFFYMEVKLGPSEEMILKKDWYQLRITFSEEQPAKPNLTTKGMKKFWKGWKENQLMRN